MTACSRFEMDVKGSGGCWVCGHTQAEHSPPTVPASESVSTPLPGLKRVRRSTQINQGRMPLTLTVFHDGKCGRCGRKLTVPESIQSGLGPVCAGQVE